MLKRAVMTLTVFASLAGAQTSSTNQARLLWQSTIANVTAAADDIPEAMYSYKPTPEVRSFGELIAHVAGAQRMFCAMALGAKMASEDEVEKTAKTKTAIVAALRESNAYCDTAYKQSDAATAAVIDMFGDTRTKLFALMLNAAHDDEHYGNIVTYMRLNKMVPPSSRAMPPAKQ